MTNEEWGDPTPPALKRWRRPNNSQNTTACCRGFASSGVEPGSQAWRACILTCELKLLQIFCKTLQHACLAQDAKHKTNNAIQQQQKKMRHPGVEPGSQAWKAYILTVGLMTR